MKISRSAAVSLLGAIAAVAAGCDSDDRCGLGTVEVDGVCVPSGPEECGLGTVAQNGECVPDGSVICETGTRFNPVTGTCVADIAGCAPGTVLVERECVPQGEVREADVEEAMEPNDRQLVGDGFASLELPAVGRTSLLHGCIEPYRDEINDDGEVTPDGERDPDLDAFLFTTDRPTLLDITIDGVEGAAGGFEVLADGPLASDGWIRIGINLVGDTTQQQVFLPVAGAYVFRAADSRSLLTKRAAGGSGKCYFATIENRPIPDGLPLTSPQENSLGGDIQFWRYEPGADGEVIESSVDYRSASAAAALVQMVNGEYRGSTRFGEVGNPVLASQLSGIAEGDEVLLLVEPITNYSLTTVRTTLQVDQVPTTPIPAEGELILTHRDDDPFGLVFFRATAGDVVRLAFRGDGAEHEIHVFEPGATSLDPGDQQSIATPCGECTSIESWIQVHRTGFYYLAIKNLGARDGEDYGVSLEVAAKTPRMVTLNEAFPGDLATGGRDFFELDLRGLVWLDYLVTSDSVRSATLRFYPRAAVGALDETVLELDRATTNPETQRVGRIVYGVEQTFLVSVETGDGEPGAFQFRADAKDFVNAGLVAGDSSVVRMVPVGEGDPGLIFFRVARDQRVRVTASPDADRPLDLALEELDRGEAALYRRDGAAADQPVSLARVIDDGGFVAVRVSAAAGSDTIEVTAQLAELGEVTGERRPMQTIPDDSDAGVVDEIAIQDDCEIASITVQVNVSHPFRGELRLTLVSPSGTSILLKDNEEFDPADNVTGVFPTTLDPVGSLDQLLAEEARGTWQLAVVDGGAGDVGLFNFWRLAVVCM